jgi:hypothetical protein
MRVVYVGGVGVLVATVIAAILAISTPTTANLWIDANGGTCTRSGSPAAYDDAAACGTFDAANDVCESGDTVLVKAGTYPYQNVTGYNTRTGPDHCTIAAQDPDVSHTRVRDMQIGNPDFTDGSRYLTVQGFQILRPTGSGQTSIRMFAESQHVTLRDIDAANFYIRNTDHTTIDGGDWGPCVNRGSEPASLCGNSKFDSEFGDPNTNVVVDGAVFHDYRNSDTECAPHGPADCHFECLFVGGVEDAVIRNSKFRNCAFFDIFMQGVINDLTIENNWFDTPWNEAFTPAQTRPTGVMFSGGTDGTLIRFNSFHPTTGISYDGNTITDARVIGNLLLYDGAIPGVTYAYNLSSGGPFTGTGNSAIGSSFPYATTAFGAAANFHLSPASGSAADGHVTGAGDDYDLATDIDGDARTPGARSAGSDE